jgi:release factor glutamine methyltransferase
MVSDKYAETLRRWHDAAYDEMRQRGEIRLSHLGREFVVPAQVFAPTPTSDLLGTAVLDEVRDHDRVLDMGTGCGVNAILAASKSRDVVGVDVNPHAIASAVANAAHNGVADRTTFFVSDVFDAVEGTFDLIIFDPPFRWFRPRDLLEASIADENYRSLTRFVEQASSHMTSGGRILVFFGTSGDIDYLTSRIEHEGFSSETVAARVLVKDGLTVTYSTQRLTSEAGLRGRQQGGALSAP